MNSVSQLRLLDIASSEVLTVTPDTSLEAVVTRFVETRVSSLVVVEHGKPVGIVTERDLLRLMCLGMAEDKPVREVMSSPLLTARFDLDFSSAQLLMANRGIRHLVLVNDDGVMLGLATETDFRRHLGSDFFDLIQSLRAVMDHGAELIDPALSLAEALRLMSAGRLDYLVGGVDGWAEGILTERDVPRLLARHVNPQALTFGEVMSRPLITISLDIPVSDAARQMDIKRLRHLGVVDGDGRLVGVVSQHRMLERLGVVLLDESRSHLEDRMGLVLEATGVGTWEYDHQLDILIRSSALNRMLKLIPGKSRETLDSVLQRIEPADRELMAACFRDLLSGEAAEFAQDYQVRGGDGHLRWMSSRGRVVEWDSQGKPLRFLGVAIDISAQKAAEQKLRLSEARFRGLMENVPLPLCHVNAQQELVFINRHFTETFGYTLEDVPTLSQWWERAYPNEAYRAWVLETWNQAIQDAAQTHGPICPIEYRVVCKNGVERIIEISGVTLGEEFLSTFIDVTESRREQGLLEFSNTILAHISRAEALPRVLDLIAREIESHVPELRCSILLVDDEGRRLRHAAAPSLPAEYAAAIDGIEIGPAVGSCGTAAHRKESVFVADIATDPLGSAFKDIAESHGLAACWSSPIISAGGAVLGTFAVYWSTPRHKVSPMARRYVGAATSLAAIAIDNARREGELLSIHQGLLRAEEIGHMGSWRWDIASARNYWSAQMYQLFGLDPKQDAPEFEDFLQNLVHPDDRALLEQSMSDVLAGREPLSSSYRRHPACGPVRYLQPSYSLIRDASGQVSAVEGALVDVTVLKLSDERLRAQLDELHRWQQVTLGREGRVLELKREVNVLLSRLGELPRYGSVVAGEGQK